MINSKLILLPLVSLMCFSCGKSGNISIKEAREWISEHYKSEQNIKTTCITVDVEGKAEKPENEFYLRTMVLSLFGYILDDELKYHEVNDKADRQETIVPMNVTTFDAMPNKEKMRFEIKDNSLIIVSTIASKEKNGNITSYFDGNGYIYKVAFFYDLIEGFDGAATINATRTFTF